MSKILPEINSSLSDFISQQKVFFVGTAAAEGRINLSPKGMDSFRILSPNKIAWLNLTGSGNETAAHLLKNNRMTIMFCSFEEKPLILRLYGEAKIFHPRDDDFHKYIGLFPKIVGSRQIIEMKVDSVQTSCGYAVPFMGFKAERTQLADSSKQRGEEVMRAYQQERNSLSIDGFETGI